MRFLMPMDLLSLGAIFGGAKSQTGPGVLAAKVVRGADTPPSDDS